MAINFNGIPSNLRIPVFAAEFDPSLATQGAADLAYRGFIVGQKLAAGTAAANSIVRVTSPEQVIPLAGRGSMLHRQALGWFASNRSTELWLGVLADDPAGVAPTGTIVVAGTASTAGTIPLYVGGERIPVGIAAGTAPNAIATAINAAINAALDLPITSTVTAATVTNTFRHKGLVGNAYDIRQSYRDGDAQGFPGGVTLTITPLAGGTSNPSLTNLLAVMADLWFQIWTHPYTDATNLAAIEAELASRFGPLRMIDGVAFTSAVGALSALTTLGAGRNSPHSSIWAQPGASPLTPPMEFAAEVAALVAFHGAIDPARPFHTLAMSRALPPVETDQFSFEERNALTFDGISPTRLAAGGVVQLERAITTYQTGPSGADDTAYLDVTTMLTLMFLRFSFRAHFARYSRHKLADDGTRFGEGQAVMTPSLGKAEALTWFRQMEERGLVEGYEQFRRDLVVERSKTDANRLNFLLPPNLINQLIVVAAQFQFRL